MPWYELFCLARPGLPRLSQAELLRAAATPILQAGGVILDLKSFGERPLAYDIRVPGSKFSEAFMWQIRFASQPETLSDLRYSLKIDERVLRHIFVRQEPHKPAPSTFTVKKRATRLLGTPSTAQR